MRLSVCFLTLDIHMDMQQPLALAPSFNNDKVSEVAAPGCATYLYLLSQRNLYTREGSKDHQGEAKERSTMSQASAQATERWDGIRSADDRAGVCSSRLLRSRI